jgi:hypothetical protein
MSKVRFGEHHEAVTPPVPAKMCAVNPSTGRELQLGDQPIEERTQERQIRESGGLTAAGVHDPLDAAHGTAVYRRASAALRSFSLYPAVMNRREVIAVLASAAGMPLAYACNAGAPPAGAGADRGSSPCAARSDCREPASPRA